MDKRVVLGVPVTATVLFILLAFGVVGYFLIFESGEGGFMSSINPSPRCLSTGHKYIKNGVLATCSFDGYDAWGRKRYSRQYYYPSQGYSSRGVICPDVNLITYKHTETFSNACRDSQLRFVKEECTAECDSCGEVRATVTRTVQDKCVVYDESAFGGWNVQGFYDDNMVYNSAPTRYGYVGLVMGNDYWTDLSHHIQTRYCSYGTLYKLDANQADGGIGWVDIGSCDCNSDADCVSGTCDRKTKMCSSPSPTTTYTTTTLTTTTSTYTTTTLTPTTTFYHGGGGGSGVDGLIGFFRGLWNDLVGWLM